MWPRGTAGLDTPTPAVVPACAPRSAVPLRRWVPHNGVGRAVQEYLYLLACRSFAFPSCIQGSFRCLSTVRLPSRQLARPLLQHGPFPETPLHRERITPAAPSWVRCTALYLSLPERERLRCLLPVVRCSGPLRGGLSFSCQLRSAHHIFPFRHLHDPRSGTISCLSRPQIPRHRSSPSIRQPSLRSHQDSPTAVTHHHRRRLG